MRRLATVTLVTMLLPIAVRAQEGYTLAAFGNPDRVNSDLGASLAIVGDIDGDLVADYVVGDPAALTLTQGGGEVRLVSGATGSTLRIHSGFLGGIAALGSAVGAAGDVDMDGVPDYLGGSPMTYPGGKAYVWSGATGALLAIVHGVQTFVANPLAIQQPEQLGASLGGVGDVTGDGVPDVAIGSPGYAPSSTITYAGRVQVFSGATGAVAFTLAGASSWTALGAAVSRAGDLNADGSPDFVVGAPRVASVSGQSPPPGFVQAIAGGSGALLWVANGAMAGDGFGSAIAAAGDVNGDGFDDVVIGAPTETAGATYQVGRAVVISGANGVPLFSITGTFPSERLGASVAGAGDVNGDGYADVVVGAPGASTGGPNAGRIVLMFGPNGSSSVTFSPAVAQDAFGASLAAGASFDGNGIPDVLVGATQTSGPGRVTALSLPGFAQIHQVAGAPPLFPAPVVSAAPAGDQDGDGAADLAFALANGTIMLVSGATNQAIRTLPAPPPAWSPSLPIVALGDVNGDGLVDFAAAAVTAQNTAQLTVVSGATGAALSTSTRTACGLDLVSLATPGDFDGDGIVDVALGCRVLSIGACPPPAVGFVELRSSASGALLAQINGLAANDDFGGSIAATGDVTGDGVPDLAVGAPSTSVGTLAAAGAIHVCSGATGATAFSIFGTAAAQHLGSHVSAIGDVNGDGRADVAASDLPGVFAPNVSSVFVHSGAGGGLLYTLATGASADLFGRPMLGAGDVDGDGVPDLAVSAQAASPGPLKWTGRVSVFSGSTGALLFTVLGIAPYQDFGDALASAGDWNHDGLADIVATSGGSLARAQVLSFAGVPAGSQAIGSGCPLASGLTPALAAFGGVPTSASGNPAFGLIVSNGSAGALGALVAGISTSSWNGAPLPLDLGPAGLAGCLQHVSIDALFPIILGAGSAGAGAARFAIPVPANPTLAGATLHFQAYVADSPAAVFPGAVTRALTLVVQ